MSSLTLPWIETAIVALLAGAVWAHFARDGMLARRIAIAASGGSLLACLAAWLECSALAATTDVRLASWIDGQMGTDWLTLDGLSAPLLPLVAFAFLLIPWFTLKTKVRRFPFGLNLLQSALALLLFSTERPIVIWVLLLLQCVPVWWELRNRQQTTRVFTAHMLMFAGMMLLGLILQPDQNLPGPAAVWSAALIAAALLIRSGSFPLQVWVPDLFERASLGTAILFVTPLPAAYALIRLVLPVAPDGLLASIGVVSLITSIYAAGMSVVQSDLRRFLAYLILSNASLVLVGMESVTTIGLTGALCAWITTLVAMTGLGLAARAVESRFGRISLRRYHGLFPHVPLLATFFLLTGLATIGFPGTIGFVGIELIVEGAVAVSPVVGLLLALVGALNGIAILRVYFLIFGGSVHLSTFSISARPAERWGILALMAVIIGLGIFPQTEVTTRYRAAEKIISQHSNNISLSKESSPWLTTHPSHPVR